MRARHRNEEVREVVPGNYEGVMVTDRARSYDAQSLSGVRQQKCMAHVLRSISEVVETKVGRGTELRQAAEGGDQSVVDGLCAMFSGAPVLARST